MVSLASARIRATATATFVATSISILPVSSSFLTISTNCEDVRNRWHHTLRSPVFRQTRRLTCSNNHWSSEEDELLCSEANAESVPKLCCLLGRGICSVEKRILEVKKDVSRHTADAKSSSTNKNNKRQSSDRLMPASEILQRIRWDPLLQPLVSEFTVQYRDRMEEKIKEIQFDAANENISGNERMYVFALPEHRIEAVKFREQLVWDKSRRLDRVFGSMNGNGVTITSVVDNYEEHVSLLEKVKEQQKNRSTAEIITQIQRILTKDEFDKFQMLTNKIRKNDDDVSSDVVEDYVVLILDLLVSEKNQLLDQNLALNELEALDLLSELVSMFPEEHLRFPVLSEISKTMEHINPNEGPTGRGGSSALPELKEEELTEKFARGSGPGGQKINKTASKVILVHEPTQLRVECQDTRSLQQNRKIARKRLRLKLDEYINGANSRTSVKAAKASKKKTKTKARNKARQKKKMKIALKEEEEFY